MSLEELIAFHEISQVKYRYLRGVDSQDWELVESCFSASASSWYDSGKLATTGAKEIAGLLKRYMFNSMYTSHIALQPEIKLTSPTTATGIWRMQDIVHFTAKEPTSLVPDLDGSEQLVGAGYYHDEYLKEPGGWKISKTGYVRLFEALARPNVLYVHVTPERGRKPA
jgi:hypothetical protein